jgi:hypothetical protein
MHDAGIAVIFPHAVKSSGLATRIEDVRFTDQGLVVRGVLRKARGAARRRGGLVGQWRARRTAIPEIEPVISERPDGRGFHPHLHDHFEREVVFAENSIVIRDRVDCLLPCLAVVFQSPMEFAQAPSNCVGPVPQYAPLFVEGGRHLEVTRIYRDGALVDRRVRRVTKREGWGGDS